MKKLLPIFLFLLPLMMQGQDSTYYPFPDSNATWMVYWNTKESGAGWDIYKLEGDTTILGKEYNKLYFRDYWDDSLKYIGAIREDSLKRVWFYGNITNASNTCREEPEDEYFLYQFGLKKGDTMIFNQTNCYSYDSLRIIEKIDSVEVFGEYRKRYVVSGGRLIGEGDYWIEGIGSRAGPLGPYLGEFENNFTLCYFEQNVDTFELDEYNCTTIGIQEDIKPNADVSIFHNPSSAHIQIQMNSSGAENYLIEILNILGKKVLRENGKGKVNLSLSHLPSGLYIVTIKNEAQKIINHTKIIIQK